MGLKKYNPVTPGRRFASTLTYDELSKSKPEKTLLRSKKRGSGRNNKGRITVRHRGGGNKRHYRLIDFARDKKGIPAKVAGIEYDPNRSANIALLHYCDGEKRYIIAPQGLTVGVEIISGPGVEAKIGNAMPLSDVPIGAFVHNIELEPGGGAKLVRSAGTGVQVMSKEGGFAQIKFRSGEIRLINTKCMATIGQVSNPDHSSVVEGKAGRRRWKGLRPTVRGVAMNPVDHPMGGGEGRTSGGGHPVSPWGKLAKSGFTRNRRKTSSKKIIQRRK